MSLENLVTTIKTRLKKLLHWWFLLVALILSVSLIRSIIRISSASEKIKEAERKLAKLEQENQSLQKQLGQATEESYIEKQARDRLGLAFKGETVIILPEEEFLVKLFSEPEEEPENLPDPNWKEWLKLFL